MSVHTERVRRLHDVRFIETQTEDAGVVMTCFEVRAEGRTVFLERPMSADSYARGVAAFCRYLQTIEPS
jgi:hypothetical protein